MKRSPLKPGKPLARTAFKSARAPVAAVGILGLSSMQRKAKAEPKPAKGPRQRKCTICRTPFLPSPPGAKVCGQDCAEKHVAAVKAKIERKADKARLIELKPLKWWRAKAKTALHAVVRARDEGKECASCDTILVKLGRIGGDYDAGHFRPVGLAKHLEFDIRNIWGQCKPCNDHKRGNFQEYERRLRLREGDAFVDALLADNEPRHLKIHDFQEIEAWSKLELKKLKGEVKCVN